MGDMYKTCRWCKYYENGCCVKDNFTLFDRETLESFDEVDLQINEPDTFYCSNWE